MIAQPRLRSAASLARNRRDYLFKCLLVLVLMTCALCAHAQQSSTPPAARLSRIEFTGLQRYSEEQVIAASGLQLGQAVDIQTLDAASNSLLATGLFTNLSYRLRTQDKQAVVTFNVEEAKGGVPVVFDNFVWFSDEELLAAVRKEVPSFDGTAPDSSGAIDTIAKALERLLQERKIPGQVEYTPGADLAGKNPEHIFTVKGVNLPICTLHFPGAGNVPQDELIKNSKSLLGTAYSRKFVAEFARVNLIPIYRQRGHLRARFKPPLPKPEADSGDTCKDGITVTLPVEEGLAYSWDRAEWEGNESLSVAELGRSLGMKSGELADGLKIDSGLESVRGDYGQKGFITVRLTPAPAFDDAGRRVTYNIKVSEGPQFRMGNLTITGLSESAANRLKEKWRLPQGEVYDASYLNEFVKKVVVQGGAGGGKKVEFGFKPDRQKLTVDVLINFK